MTTLHFANARLIDPEAQTDAPGSLLVRDGLIAGIELAADRDRQVRLADPRWPQEDHILPSLDEAELVQALDLLALDARLEIGQ